MRLSGYGSQMLKLRICVLQLQVKTLYLIEADEWDAGGLRRQDEKERNVSFSPHLSKAMPTEQHVQWYHEKVAFIYDLAVFGIFINTISMHTLGTYKHF